MDDLNGLIRNQIQKLFNLQKKNEISKKYHASFMPDGDASLPPEIEAEWLKQIEEFEDQFEAAREIPLLEYIGSPILKRIEDISIHELAGEYDRLELMLMEKGIWIDFPDRLDIRARYRFISEELIHEMIADIHIPGMQSHFIYEEYHPGEGLN
jgi:hypothetical protein